MRYSSRYHARRAPEPPPSRSGSLYYVRLKTPIGLMYKLGFTTLNSVNERLAFQGKGHEKFIDRELCFVPLDNAWDVEQELHHLFREKALFKFGTSAMPFYLNGQSELYGVDILGMDAQFTEEQAENTRIGIIVEQHRFGDTSEDTLLRLRQNLESTWRAKHERKALFEEGRQAELSPPVKLLLTVVLSPLRLLFEVAFFLVRLAAAQSIREEKRAEELIAYIKHEEERQIAEFDLRMTEIRERRKELARRTAEIEERIRRESATAQNQAPRQLDS